MSASNHVAAKPLVLVTNPTSRLGRLTIGHLCRYNRVAVRALVADTSESANRVLEAAGAEPFAGSLDDPPSISRALCGVSAICSLPEVGAAVDTITRRARFLAGAALAAKTPHFVHVSIAGAADHDGFDLLKAALTVEQNIRATGIRPAILRPVPRFESFDVSWPARYFLVGALRTLLGHNRELHLISESDVAWFAARSCERPEASAGLILEIAGDKLTAGEIAAAHKRATGSALRGLPVPSWLAEPISPDMISTARWLRTHAFTADLSYLRRQHPNLMRFERWLRRRARGEQPPNIQLTL